MSTSGLRRHTGSDVLLRAMDYRLARVSVLALLVAACGQVAQSPSPTGTSTTLPRLLPAASPVSTPAPTSPSPPPTGWQRAGSMVFPRLGFRSALLGDGTIVVVGNEGCYLAGEPTDSERAEVYDPAADRWSEVGALNKQRDAPALVPLLDGGAMVLGGSNDQSQPFSSTKIYSPSDRSWSDGPLMLRARAKDAVTLQDGSVLAVGQGRAEILDRGATAWRRSPPPPSTLFFDRLLLASGDVLATGEWDDEPGIPVFMRFDPDRETWHAIEPPDVLRPEPVALADGSLLALGDDEGGGHVQRYDSKTGTWGEPAQMGTGRIRAQVTLLRDGRVLVAGGVELRSEPVDGGYSVTEVAPLDSTEIYDPATDTWTPGPRLLGARQGGHAITLADGSVLVFGGYVEKPPEPGIPDTGTPGRCPTPLATTERLFGDPTG